jgi:DNA-binding transcriptional MerR regulator
MAQEEIRELIRMADDPEADCSDVDALLARHLAHVRERLLELQSLERTLEQLQASCSEGRTVSECGILGGLENDSPIPTVGHNHVPGTHGKKQ